MTFEDEVTTYDVNQGYQTYDITLRLSLRVYTTHITAPYLGMNSSQREFNI